jgi:hypothetical protein
MSDASEEKITYVSMIWLLPPMVAKASWDAFQARIPWGGTFGATLMVIMSNDSGEYPYAPLVAGLIAFPVAIICDTIFYIPCMIMRSFGSKPSY